ncbi:hypothetical protein BD779DRAFT_1411347, partial [Infundibulicybe gibba]
MCYREVHCVKYACGHQTPSTERRVDCNSSQCRYSNAHNSNCHSCSTTCKQWLRPAQMVITQTSQSSCGHC